MGFFTSKKKVREALIADARSFLGTVERRGGFETIATNVAMKSGESAFLMEQTVLSEARTVTKRSSTGMGLRMMKGVYIGGSSGESRGQAELQKIDAGILVFTNKRIIFDGRIENRVLPIDKIISINPSLNSIEISTENKQKSSFFTVKNPFIWMGVLTILHAQENHA